jgi:SAM-dependent methyltransferase
MIRSRLTRYAYATHDRDARDFDRRYGTDTGGELAVSALGLPHGVAEDARPYAGSPPRLLRVLLPKITPIPERTSFVDLGSGKGRTLLVAAELGFQSCVGVEFSAELHEVAKANRAAVARSSDGIAGRVQLVHGDAGQFVFPDTPLVVFLNNPFQGEVMQAVVQNLEHSVRERPRPVHLIYQSVHGASVESGTATNLELFASQTFLRSAWPRIVNPHTRVLLDPFILRVYRAITSRG